MASRIEACREKLMGSALVEMSNLNFSSFNSVLLSSRALYQHLEAFSSSWQYLIHTGVVNISNSPPQIPGKDFLGVGVGVVKPESLA